MSLFRRPRCMGFVVDTAHKYAPPFSYAVVGWARCISANKMGRTHQTKLVFFGSSFLVYRHAPQCGQTRQTQSRKRGKGRRAPKCPHRDLGAVAAACGTTRTEEIGCGGAAYAGLSPWIHGPVGPRRLPRSARRGPVRRMVEERADMRRPSRHVAVVTRGRLSAGPLDACPRCGEWAHGPTALDKREKHAHKQRPTMLQPLNSRRGQKESHQKKVNIVSQKYLRPVVLSAWDQMKAPTAHMPRSSYVYDFLADKQLNADIFGALCRLFMIFSCPPPGGLAVKNSVRVVRMACIASAMSKRGRGRKEAGRTNAFQNSMTVLLHVVGLWSGGS